MILIDSSGWIEFFTGGGNAAKYGSYLEVELMTSDRDLRGLPGVIFLPKPARGRGNRVKGP